jgi:hypothetical protein
VHAGQNLALARFRFAARRRDQRIAAFLGQPLQLGDHRTEELALEFRHDGADDAALGAPQIGGERVDAIAERLDRIVDALHVLGTHGGDALHDLGDGGGGDAGAACHVVDRRTPLLGCLSRHRVPPGHALATALRYR